ncbi:MAG: hypothetical protein PHG95_02320 [Patescibacteria group bacterium]|nr:hypothetical protein [Patescibacteria group bacterium]
MEPNTENSRINNPEKRGKSWIFTAIAGLVIIALVAFFANHFGKNKKSNDNTKAQTEEPIAPPTSTPCTPETSTIVGVDISGDSLVRMYQEIARLQAALKACEEGKKATQTSRKSSTPAASNQTRTSSSAPAANQTRTSSSAPAANASQSTNPMIATNQYIGDVIGDGGCAFDENSKLFFYVKTSLLNKIPNRTQTSSNLNSESGPKGEEVGEYTYYRTPILILNDMLDKDWAWTAYVGNNSQYGYDMWLWHELVKLNANLKNDPQIQDNGLGGYQFVSKINYHSR